MRLEFKKWFLNNIDLIGSLIMLALLMIFLVVMSTMPKN